MDENLKKTWTKYRYSVVDIEGNGQQPPNLVEIAIVPVIDGQIGELKSWLVKPPKPITPIARSFHKISDADVDNAPGIGEIGAEICEALKDSIFVAHNAQVETGVLCREPGYQPRHTIDTLKLARRMIPGLPSYSLTSLVKGLGLIVESSAGMRPHRAGYDALAAARLFIHIASKVGAAPHDLSDLLLLADQSRDKTEGTWKTGNLF